MKANKARFDQFVNGTQIHPLLIDHVSDHDHIDKSNNFLHLTTLSYCVLFCV